MPHQEIYVYILHLILMNTCMSFVYFFSLKKVKKAAGGVSRKFGLCQRSCFSIYVYIYIMGCQY